MEPFINNHQFNKISMTMNNLQRLLKFNSDEMIVNATKEINNCEIRSLFYDLSEEYHTFVDITAINLPEDVDRYMERLAGATYGMKPVSEAQLKKLFRKEKKLKLPTLNFEMKSFLGWFDQSRRKLYLVHWIEGKLTGMVCHVKDIEASNSRMCAICGHINEGSDVVPVSVKCKTKNPENYHVFGFNICKDSISCNRRVTSIDPLENLIKKANKVHA